MLAFERRFVGKRVLVTGHTGFKGGWLTLWLNFLGAEVHGIGLEPNTDPNLFQVLDLDLENSVNHNVFDIRSRDRTFEEIGRIDPHIVFHLAAQPLVRQSYDEPIETFETNVLGTAYVLEACRQASSTKAIVCVTTDKVYENKEWIWPYRENERLGGKDPYSASKAAAELISASYQNILRHENSKIALATARGGNVIGGGDWSADRLIPDVVRALQANEALMIRNPSAVRPWQHVLALCHGYLQLAASLMDAPDQFRGAWNFGPNTTANCSVHELLELFENAWRLPELHIETDDCKPEAQMLAIDSTKANSLLNWLPPYSLNQAIFETAEWYRAHDDGFSKMSEFSLKQLHAYREILIKMAGVGNEHATK